MSVRVRYRIEGSVSSTSAEDKDLGNMKTEVVDDSLNKGGTWKTFLAAGSSDIQINLDNISSAKMLYIRTTPKDPLLLPGPITLKRGSTSGEAIIVAPLGSNKEGHFLLTTTTLTSLYAYNPGTTDMELTILVCGD
jgi:hypothetical protein